MSDNNYNRYCRERSGGRRHLNTYPDDTRLWAALKNLGGGTWGGCVYDAAALTAALAARPSAPTG